MKLKGFVFFVTLILATVSTPVSVSCEDDDMKLLSTLVTDDSCYACMSVSTDTMSVNENTVSLKVDEETEEEEKKYEYE